MRDIANRVVHEAYMRAEEQNADESQRPMNQDSQKAQSSDRPPRFRADLRLDGDEPDVSSTLPVVPDAPSTDASSKQKEVAANAEKEQEKNQ